MRELGRAALAVALALPLALPLRAQAQPAAALNYLGYTIGDGIEQVLKTHGPFPYRKEINSRTWVYEDNNEFSYPLRTIFVFVDGRLAALEATFDNQVTLPGAVEDMLTSANGPPDGDETRDWVDKSGRRLRSVRLTWTKAGGTMQLDDKFERFDRGAVRLNPQILDGLTGQGGL